MNIETKYLQWTQERKPVVALSFSSPYSQSRVYIQRRQLNSKRYMHLNDQSSTIYNSQDKKQPKCQSIDDWVKKMWVKWNIIFVSYSVVSDSLQPHGLQLARLPCPWNSPGKNTRVGCHSLPQGTFSNQGLNLRLLHCGQILYHLSHRESPKWNIALP